MMLASSDYYDEWDHTNLRPTPRADASPPHPPPRDAGRQPVASSWNERFYRYLGLPDATDALAREKHQKLTQLASDFAYQATTFARLIIAERNLPLEQKTIKPQIGLGYAGGPKFICGDVLYKFCIDYRRIYGGDAKAQKAAGHELRGLNWFLQAGLSASSSGCSEAGPSPGLRVPLTCLVDYAGVRLLATALAKGVDTNPTHSKSLVYGSPDGGVTVRRRLPAVNEMMREVAQILNLAPHRVGPREAAVELCCAADVEVHRVEGGRFFVIDAARVWPPEDPGRFPATETGSFLHRLLRPELVRRFKRPLSSDAFSRMGWHEAEKHNAHVRKASEFLHDDCIPALAKHLDGLALRERQQGDVAGRRLAGLDVKTTLHARGINLRWLGEVLARSTEPAVWTLLGIEALARTFKVLVQHEWRLVADSTCGVVEGPFQIKLVEMLNNLFFGMTLKVAKAGVGAGADAVEMMDVDDAKAEDTDTETSLRTRSIQWWTSELLPAVSSKFGNRTAQVVAEAAGVDVRWALTPPAPAAISVPPVPNAGPSLATVPSMNPSVDAVSPERHQTLPMRTAGCKGKVRVGRAHNAARGAPPMLAWDVHQKVKTLLCFELNSEIERYLERERLSHVGAGRGTGAEAMVAELTRQLSMVLQDVRHDPTLLHRGLADLLTKHAKLHQRVSTRAVHRSWRPAPVPGAAAAAEGQAQAQQRPNFRRDGPGDAELALAAATSLYDGASPSLSMVPASLAVIKEGAGTFGRSLAAGHMRNAIIRAEDKAKEEGGGGGAAAAAPPQWERQWMWHWRWRQADIAKIRPRVKPMRVVPHAAGFVALQQATRAAEVGDEGEFTRCIDLALDRLESIRTSGMAHIATPKAFVYLARALAAKAQHRGHLRGSEATEALRMLSRARELCHQYLAVEQAEEKLDISALVARTRWQICGRTGCGAWFDPSSGTTDDTTSTAMHPCRYHSGTFTLKHTTARRVRVPMHPKSAEKEIKKQYLVSAGQLAVKGGASNETRCREMASHTTSSSGVRAHSHVHHTASATSARSQRVESYAWNCCGATSFRARGCMCGAHLALGKQQESDRGHSESEVKRSIGSSAVAGRLSSGGFVDSDTTHGAGHSGGSRERARNSVPSKQEEARRHQERLTEIRLALTKAAALSKGGAAVVKLMVARLDDVLMQELGCEQLEGQVTADPSMQMRSQMLRSGALPAVSAAMIKHPTSHNVQAFGVSILTKLSKLKAAGREMLEHSGISALANTLQYWQTDQRAVNNAVLCVIRFIMHDDTGQASQSMPRALARDSVQSVPPAIQEALQASGIARLAMDAAERFPHDRHLQRNRNVLLKLLYKEK